MIIPRHSIFVAHGGAPTAFIDLVSSQQTWAKKLFRADHSRSQPPRNRLGRDTRHNGNPKRLQADLAHFLAENQQKLKGEPYPNPQRYRKRPSSRCAQRAELLKQPDVERETERRTWLVLLAATRNEAEFTK